MKRLLFLCAILCSCYSTSPTVSSYVKDQQLTENDIARLEKYKSFQGDYLIDSLLEENSDALKIEPLTKAYEGVLMLELFGLDYLPLDAQAEILNEFFDNIPEKKDIASIANFVFPQWFDSGELFIFNATKVVAEKKLPAVSALTNVVPLLREIGADRVKKTPASFVLYPKLDTQDGISTEYAGDIYTFIVCPDGRVSAAKTASKTCKESFEKLSAKEKIALADNYLRDFSRENDAIAAAEMEKIYFDENTDAKTKLLAAEKLFMKFLFENDIDNARAITQKSVGSAELKKKGNEKIKVFFEKTAPNILNLAKKFAASGR